jgi:hypothetical protein
MLVEQIEVPRPLAVHSDDGDLPPAGVQQWLLSLAAELPWAQGCFCPALSESGFSDNTQDSF